MPAERAATAMHAPASPSLAGEGHPRAAHIRPGESRRRFNHRTSGPEDE